MISLLTFSNTTSRALSKPKKTEGLVSLFTFEIFHIIDFLEYNGIIAATITVRDLPDKTKQSLRVHPAQAGISLEAYARHILQKASRSGDYKPASILELADRYFGAEHGADIKLPAGRSQRQPVGFKTMILLDTNAISELMREQPDARVRDWIASQKPTQLVVSTISLAEIERGLARLPKGQRRKRLESNFAAFVAEAFDGGYFPLMNKPSMPLEISPQSGKKQVLTVMRWT